MKAEYATDTNDLRTGQVGNEATESSKGRRWSARHLLRFGTVGALFTTLCCLGFSALISLLPAIGLGFLINDAILLPLLLVFLGVYVAGLVLGWRQHRRLPVLVLGILVAAANFAFIYVVFVRPVAYAVLMLLIAVSIWDLVERKRVLSGRHIPVDELAERESVSTSSSKEEKAMKFAELSSRVLGLILATPLLPTATLLAAPEPVAVLALQYQQSERKWIQEGESLFGHYLGSGNGDATGVLQGSVSWDLYEDQSRDDMHPAQFRGFVEQAGKRYPFQIIGVYTPNGLEKVMTPTGHETLRHWTLSGTIVFEDSALLGVRHAPVTGSVDTGIGVARHTVWVDGDGTR